VQSEFASIPLLLRHLVQGFLLLFWNSQRYFVFQIHLGIILFPCWSFSYGHDIQWLYYQSGQSGWWYTYIREPLLVTSPQWILSMQCETMWLYHYTCWFSGIQFGELHQLGKSCDYHMCFLWPSCPQFATTRWPWMHSTIPDRFLPTHVVPTAPNRAVNICRSHFQLNTLCCCWKQAILNFKQQTFVPKTTLIQPHSGIFILLCRGI